jgi:aminopeptidase N
VRALAILSLAATAAAPAVRSAAREPLPTGPAWPEGIGPPPSPIRPREAERPGSAERDAAAAAQYAAGAAGRLLGTPADCPHDYDALHYDVTLAVDHGARTISGTTIVRFRSETASLAEVALSLKALSVSSVLRGSTPLSFTHANDTLRVTLDTPVALGDTAEIAVEYGGDPFNEGFGGFYTVDVPSTDFNLGVGITSNPPSLGRAWFPCFDSPCDKATADFHIESNLQKRGVANGAFLGVDVDSTAGTRLWHWRESHQIATYLMAASIARYDSVLVDSLYPWIEYYVHNGFFAQAPGTFANVKHMMTAFLSLFGSYPWDRFSYVTTNVGDMEHQTCVFHATSLVTGTTAYDDILSHEMGHQWWGDLVTYADWREIWLSEGFATYCEALFREQFYGAANFHAYVTASLFQPYLAQQATLTYPIYDPVSKWGTISYEKGGSVLHMLRHVMGDSLFFAGLAAYRAAHAEDVATTEDFRAACESVYGGSLDWFFQEWIYSGGHPEYTWGWYATPNGPNTDVQIRVRQTQTVGPTFTMPIDFEIQTTAGDTIVVGLVDAAFEVLDFTVPGSVTDVVFDPDDWVLDEHTLGPTGVAAGEEDARGAAGAVQVALLPASPNPAPGGGTTLAFRLPDARAATLAVFAADGRLVRTLASSRVFGPGEHRFAWDGRDERGARVASGAYLYRLDAGATRLTRRLTLVR